MFRNAEVADIPIIMSSIDPCVACADRMSIVGRNGDMREMTLAELRRKSHEKTKKIMGR